jgi:hypothetical protein
MKDDRRAFTRFIFKNDEIQIFSDDAILFGKLNDISKGGLSFKYNPVSDGMIDTNSINILAKGKDRFNLYHMSCRTIYDISCNEESQLFLGFERRKCGIKFYWLKEAHNKKLELLLNHYVVKSLSILR